jgi:hypothetical protein
MNLDAGRGGCAIVRRSGLAFSGTSVVGSNPTAGRRPHDAKLPRLHPWSSACIFDLLLPCSCPYCVWPWPPLPPRRSRGGGGTFREWDFSGNGSACSTGHYDDNIVWGTSVETISSCADSEDDNIVWGTAVGAPEGDDNIVWGTSVDSAEDDDNIVWGTGRDDNIVWGTRAIQRRWRARRLMPSSRVVDRSVVLRSAHTAEPSPLVVRARSRGWRADLPRLENDLAACASPGVTMRSTCFRRWRAPM